jgi:hypothetical protein
MANDEFDNARADKAILEEMNVKFAATRARRRAMDPRNNVAAGALCPSCSGSGLDIEGTHFDFDEFNPEGHWVCEPCETCHGSGLSPKINNAIENGVYAERDLKHAHELLSKATEGLYNARAAVEAMPETTEDPKAVESALGTLVDELTEVLEAVDPEPPETDRP